VLKGYSEINYKICIGILEGMEEIKRFETMVGNL